MPSPIQKLNEIAGRELGVKQRKMNPGDAYNLSRLIQDFNGYWVIEADFEAWCETVKGKNIFAPVSSYIDLARNRLQSSAEFAIIQSDPRITEMVAFVYGICQYPARPADVAKMLAESSPEDIRDAFKNFTENLTDSDLKWAPKNFFQDGAGVGIILARRQKKAADAALAASVATSIETGVEARRVEADARKKRIDEEEKLAEKLGDSPF